MNKRDGDDRVYIYALIDPRNCIVRYVGKTVDLARRLREHLQAKERTRCSAWVKHLRKLSLAPQLVILEEATLANWQERERWWIAHYKSSGVDLVNHLDGGQGLHKGARLTPETIAKLREIFRGRIFSSEHRAKLSTAAKRRVMTPESKQRFARAVALAGTSTKGRVFSLDHRRKLSIAAKRRGAPKNKANAPGRVFTPEHRAKLSESAKRRATRQRSQ